MMPEEKVELAGLLEEKMFRCEHASKFELIKTIINGVEQTIFVVKLGLRPLELAKLLEYRTRSAFDFRRDRLKAAEMRLGMWENGRFIGHGLAELVGKARHGKPLTRDEWVVMHAGFSNPGEPFSSEGSRKKGGGEKDMG